MSASSACHNLLLSSLTAFYAKRPHYRKLFYEIVEGLSPLSLRVIDWFVTHHARTHQILYWIDDATQQMYETYPEEGGNNLRKFSLYLDYRAQLKSYTKMYMDSFRRHERITFVLETDPFVAVETTVGQLNFFRWALQNHVVDYVMRHLAEIEHNMATHQKNLKVQSSHKKPDPPALAANTVTRAPCHLRFD
jgi:hypothetical protein